MSLMNRTHVMFGFTWLLFRTLMVSVGTQDYYRNDDGNALWQPILWESSCGLLWESSSMMAATALPLAQRHFTRRHRHLPTTPWR